MNISKREQRVLHELALGGEIQYRREGKKIIEINCFSRDGFVLSNCNLEILNQLKHKKLIKSKKSGCYHITKLGLTSVRAQLNQR